MIRNNPKIRLMVSSFAAFTAMTSLVSTTAVAHVGFSRDNAYTLGEEPRQYKEGSTVFFDMTLPHACSDDAGNSYPTRGVRVLLPNDMAIPETYTASKSGERHGANALMGVKVRASTVWRTNPITKGEVSPFFSHGVRSNDVRAIQWSDGQVDNDHYDRLEFRAKLPTIDPESCLASIKVVVPAVQWCTQGHVIAWIGTAASSWEDGAQFPRRRVETDYAPSFEIVRTSSLPERCGEGESIEIRPSTQEIDEHLGFGSLIKVRQRVGFFPMFSF